MKEFRSSQNATERETYACMVQNLFDEWKFFPKYPKKELNMTARLFGKIISEKKIIDGVVTDIGLKCIVEGLKREGKMFDFAITALEECKSSIEHETGLNNILTCKQLKEKKPELFEFIQKRYMELHGPDNSEETPMPSGLRNPAVSPQEREIPQTRGPQSPAPFMPQPPIRQITTPNREIAGTQIMPGIQDPRMINPNYMGNMGVKPMIPHTNPLIGTPTQLPGKYFDKQQPQGWIGTPQQDKMKGMYGGVPGQQRSTTPFQNQISLGPSALDSVNSLAPKALKLTSKDFKPKTQKVQEYLKKDEMCTLPQEFMEFLTTTLNMTGSDQIYNNAKKLEEEIKEEYIPQIAHLMVVRRVIESDEKRIEFFAIFFNCMENKNMIKALIKE